MLAEEIGREVVVMSGKLLDVVERVPAVVGPRDPGLFERAGQRLEIVRVTGRRTVMMMRVVDNGCVGTDEHQMVRRRGAGHLRKISIAQRVLRASAKYVAMSFSLYS